MLFSRILVTEKARTPKDEVPHEDVTPLGLAAIRETTGRKDRAIDVIFVVFVARDDNLLKFLSFFSEAASKARQGT